MTSTYFLTLLFVFQLVKITASVGDCTGRPFITTRNLLLHSIGLRHSWNLGLPESCGRDLPFGLPSLTSCWRKWQRPMLGGPMHVLTLAVGLDVQTFTWEPGLFLFSLPPANHCHVSSLTDKHLTCCEELFSSLVRF